MALSTTARNAAVSALVSSGATYLSLHTADPADTGANEITGGVPVYARKGTITWSSPAANGAVSLTSSWTFDIPAGVTVTHYGVWDALTGGNFRFGGPLSIPETFAAQGTYTVTSVVASVPAS